MKILNSPTVSSFGGLNFVIEEVIKLKIDELLKGNMPILPKQSTYNWFDIIMSYWSVFFCGGDCAEDLSINLKDGLKNNPFIKIPSPDRVLNRLKSLSVPAKYFTTQRGNKEHHFSVAEQLNRINLKMLSSLPGFEKDNVVLDYDNTIIFSEKADSERTYKKENGYNPGVGLIGHHVVYVENRNGKSNAHILQHETIDRMAALLNEAEIKIDAIRADSASYTYDIIKSMERVAKRIFVRARMTAGVEKAISKIQNWEEVVIGDDILHRSSITFTPFLRKAREDKSTKTSLQEYRIVVTKEARRDGQLNMFTGEACNYSIIMTNDFELSNDEVVFFYNARGASEREFDILKNDFGWNRMPFSKLEQNTVFLIITAMCKNLYVHMIEKFSRLTNVLSPSFRIKKFIFRFICIPAKWVYSGRIRRLRLYGSIAFKT
ncbi:IS1380 family transposase [Marinifilum sp. RC60d5]|uniref:IS1380 family transposase n=1 Tax=Marinifilum sp. RC60d5 TaxID=3458414 RepID=UPI004035A768